MATKTNRPPVGDKNEQQTDTTTAAPTRSIRELFDLEGLATRLKVGTDEFCQALETIQAKVAAHPLDVEVWLDEPIATSAWRETRDAQGEPTGTREYDADELGYGQLDGQGAFLIRRRRYVEERDTSGLPL